MPRNDKSQPTRVQSSWGGVSLDSTGSAIGAARMDPSGIYSSAAQALQEHINSGSEPAWKQACQVTDKIYNTVSAALEALENESPFLEKIKQQVGSAKRLFFKPNIVTLPLIDFQTHGPGIPGANTHWEFVAAVMRWFHDRGAITYHQMAVGEGGMTSAMDAANVSRKLGRKVTPEAIMEGRYGAEYGGWAFYFVRQYLADRHPANHTDDPRQGYQESLDGVCLAPGQAAGKLLFYDLNRLDEANSREVAVPDGVNFQSLTLHKVLVGGHPGSRQDSLDWPGSVVVNLPILKIHVMELLTGAVKNLGMGVYGMQANSSREAGKYEWKYAIPAAKVPLYKLKVPHQRWICQTDEDTLKPIRDKNGNFIWRQTGGMEATMTDSFQAVKGQNVMLLHVVEAIECTNIYHSGYTGVAVPEGFILASQDPVALDNLCARYLFNMLPLVESETIQLQYHLQSDVIQRIPSVRLEGSNIVTTEGYDSCYSRYHAFKHWEQRGLGQLPFYVRGKDLWQGGDLASFKQHLGRVEKGVFSELITTTVYHAMAKPLMDFQAGMLAYLELDDQQTGADHKRELLQFQDENGDGVIDYLEGGKNAGSTGAFMYSSILRSPQADRMEALKLGFLIAMAPAKWIHKEWNSEGLETGEHLIGQAVGRALAMSRVKAEKADPLYPARMWGNGRWPSLNYILQLMHWGRVYGPFFPDRIDIGMAPYAKAFSYADLKWNGAKYCTPQAIQKCEDIIGHYHQAVARGEKPLPFRLYVPHGYGVYNGVRIPNVEETDNPALIFTASFPENEVWRELRFSEYPWLQTVVPEDAF
jgi:hypothetical protein